MDGTATARWRTWLRYPTLIEVKTGVSIFGVQLVPMLFSAVVGANCLTMSWMNFFESPATHISAIYLSFMFLTVLLTLASGVTFPKLTREEHLFCLSLGLVMFLPRLPYLLE